MKKYSIPVVVTCIGVTIFLLGELIGEVIIKGINFSVDDLLLNIAATFISIAVLALTYETFGGEPITNLIEYLIKLQGAAFKTDNIGIEEVVEARRKFDYERIHKDLKNGREMFIASRTFDSIKYSDVKLLFKEHLDRKGTSIKILIAKGPDANIRALIDFHTSLPEPKRRKFEIKSTDKITCCIYGSDYVSYVTPYLNTLRGEESPSLLCINKNKHSVYHIYRGEFYAIWAEASQI